MHPEAERRSTENLAQLPSILKLMSVRESKLTESLDRVGFSMCVLGEGFSFLYIAFLLVRLGVSPLKCY
jgi:hypothetical protein